MYVHVRIHVGNDEMLSEVCKILPHFEEIPLFLFTGRKENFCIPRVHLRWRMQTPMITRKSGSFFPCGAIKIANRWFSEPLML
jgi:hypothetical protein